MAHELETPLNFVTKGRDIWPEILCDDVASIGADELRARCNDGFTCWILQTYVIMRQAGLNVVHAPFLRDGFVNVVHPFFFGLRDRRVSPYLLSCRADAHRPWSANFWLEQSGVRGVSHRNAWVPIWPQPGLIPRDAARGSTIENLVFKGEERNFDQRFREEAFLRDLGKLGVTLRLDVFSGATDAGPTAETTFDWHDYRTVDLVIAARNLSPEDAAGKPASKLVNGWLAGVPALLGPEPAYQEQRRSGLDYIEIRTPEDVLAAIRQFRQLPDLYSEMVANGHRRSVEFTAPRILEKWLAVLNGPIRDDFLRWERKSIAEKAILAGRDMVRDRLAKRAQMRALKIGPRILDAPARPAAGPAPMPGGAVPSPS